MGGWTTTGKGKGFFKRACHVCGQIGHRVADCPKNGPKDAINPVGEAQDGDHSWEDKEAFGKEGWGYLAVIEACRPPPGLPIPIKNRFSP